VLGVAVMMSDREKTAIDCIDRTELAGGVAEAASIPARASRRLDWQKAAEYLDRMDSTALLRRFGWVMDHVGAEMPSDVRRRLLRRAEAGSKLGLGGTRKSEWNV